METAFTSPRTKPLYRATQVVWYVLGVIEILLGFRFVLKAMGANPAAGFTNFIYSFTQPMAAPFLNVFRISRVEGSPVVMEWTTLLAMIVYLVVAYGILKIFVMSKTVSTPEAAIKLEQQEP
ncbi:MAG TPA: YggT family protein [Candidatus Peribacteria bacterium]|nr:YggT family protein [Candidatus Peribacteria bacterium]